MREMSFRIHALPREVFSHYFQMSDEELRAYDGLKRIVDKRPGFPCRVSLEDAHVGERVLLINYEHQSCASPFRSCHAVYVREHAETAKCELGQVPELFRSRLMSLRAFDREGMMLDADVVEGRDLEASIERLLSGTAVQYLHLHYAKPGCYAARVERG
jgi:hypothetical protein